MINRCCTKKVDLKISQNLQESTCSRFSSLIMLQASDISVFLSEAAVQRCSVKKVLLEISQNSQEHTCAIISFLIKLQASALQLFLKKRLWYRCFPVNFAKFLRTTFFIEHLWWLLLSYEFAKFLKTPFSQNTSGQLLLHKEELKGRGGLPKFPKKFFLKDRRLAMS